MTVQGETEQKAMTVQGKTEQEHWICLSGTANNTGSDADS